jgi:16S rRNA (uracil1498-N3)-methyltransferase
MIRLYVPNPLRPGAEVDPTPDQTRYLVSVMRLDLGEELLLFNGRDGEWTARLTEIAKRGCRLTVEARTQLQAIGPDLDLVMALVKRPRLETIVEKATELGVRRIRLLTTHRTQADHTNVARLQAIATEAAEQTGRLDVPHILDPLPLDRLLEWWDKDRRLMFCDEAGDDPFRIWGGTKGRGRPVLDALRGQGGGPWAVLVGPEGGFDSGERRALRAMALVTPVTLGPNILRADTAAISALTLWQAALGDWAAQAPDGSP